MIALSNNCSNARYLLIACAFFWPLGLSAAPTNLADLTEKLTVVAGAADLKLSAGKAQLVEPEGEPAYVELMEHRGLSWTWPQDRFVPGVDYTLSVELSHVGSLVKIPCNGLLLYIWNGEGYRLHGDGKTDQDGNQIAVTIDRARLRSIGTNTDLVEVGTFQPAAVAGVAYVDFQEFVGAALSQAGGDYPRVYRLIFTPQLAEKSPEELRKIQEEWKD